MRIYRGEKNPEEGGPATVIVWETAEEEPSRYKLPESFKAQGKQRILDPKPSQRIRNHSPDGFQWGYGGSGPAQLALALLLDLGIAGWAAEAIYQKFKFEVVAGLEPTWTKTESELRAVADRLLKERER